MIFLKKSQKSTAVQHWQLQQGFPGDLRLDHITDQMRIFSMPAKYGRYGGLGILEPESVSSLQYESSIKATSQLTNAIFSQQKTLKIDEGAQQDTMKEVKQKKKTPGPKHSTTVFDQKPENLKPI